MELIRGDRSLINCALTFTYQARNKNENRLKYLNKGLLSLI